MKARLRLFLATVAVLVGAMSFAPTPARAYNWCSDDSWFTYNGAVTGWSFSKSGNVGTTYYESGYSCSWYYGAS